jgi:hypothetical protein
MKRIAIHFSSDIDQREIAEAMRASGLHLRAVNDLLLVDRVPGIIRKDALPNVVPIKRAVKP